MWEIENDPVEFVAVLVYQVSHRYVVQLGGVDSEADLGPVPGQFSDGLRNRCVLVFLFELLPSIENRCNKANVGRGGLSYLLGAS